MKWFWKKDYKIPDLPSVDDISTEIPAISEYLEAFRLPDAFKAAEIDTLPVIDNTGKIVGIVSEYDLAQILPEWSFEEDSYRYDVKVADVMTKEVWAETENTNIKEILSNIHKLHTRVIPIVDEYGRYTGKAITRQALIGFLTRMVKPRSIGGLATPIGVYMTDGKHQAGPGNLGLVLTGFALGGIIVSVELLSGFIFTGRHLPEIFTILVQLILFILILRLTPLVKYHAAEHQTIHAIEKGLPLTVETVIMQPRPHKRCGTNIMVLLFGIQFVLLASFEFVKIPFIQFIILIIGFLFVFSNWRSLGMWLQEFFTTKRADLAQIENGIAVGEEILRKHKEDTSPRSPGFFIKLWNMGLIQILISFLFILWVFNFILHLV
jgi:CBS domain-containing protein